MMTNSVVLNKKFNLQDEIEKERQVKTSTEKQLRDLQSEINDLKKKVEEEKSTKDSINRNNKSVEEEIHDLREELDDQSEYFYLKF